VHAAIKLPAHRQPVAAMSALPADLPSENVRKFVSILI